MWTVRNRRRWCRRRPGRTAAAAAAVTAGAARSDVRAASKVAHPATHDLTEGEHFIHFQISKKQNFIE